MQSGIGNMKYHIVLQHVFVVGTIASQFRNPGIARGEVKYSNTSSISSTTTLVSVISSFENPFPVASASAPASAPPSRPLPPPPPPSLSSPFSNATQTDCLWNSTVTYVGSVYPTVYVTVDTSYEVTVSASNVSLTDAPTILETPLEACLSTIVPTPHVIGATPGELPPPPPPTPLFGTLNPPLSSIALSPEPPEALSSAASDDGFVSYSLPPPDGLPTYSIPTLVGFKVTSTIIVTKKTPVPVVQVPQQTNPPVTFPQPSRTKGTGPVATLKGGNAEGNNDSSNNNNNNNNNNDGGNSNPGSNTANNNSGPGNDNSPTSVPGTNTNSTPQPVVGGINSAVSKLGQIIASIINSPFAAPVPTTTQQVVATPTTAIVGAVPVIINTASVRIGSSVVPLPTAAQAQTVIAVGGQTFTVQPNQIIGPSTTYSIASVSAQNFILKSAPTTVTQSASVVTANGIVLTVGPSQAVISGTTYRIGPNASPTAIVVNSQTINLGANGVVFPFTTFAPAVTIANNKYELVTIDGLTVSVDATEAIISGTTFTIGPGAPTSTATVGGKPLTIGPSGIVLASTTIHPTSVPTTTVATTGAGSSNTNGEATQTSSTSSTATAQLRNNAISSRLSSSKSLLAWTLGLTVASWTLPF